MNDYKAYAELIEKYKTLSSTDFEGIGRWKDAANTPAKWKANVASVAYKIWMQAASDLPPCPEDDHIAEFLENWSKRAYIDEYKNRVVKKEFGLSRATTLLHFLSGSRFPIFDSRVRRALKRLLNMSVTNTVHWYLHSYVPLFSELAETCGTDDQRTLDMALFSYGGRTLQFPD